MSAFAKYGHRCDWCGKFTTNSNGEYTKPDGISAGYIRQPEWETEHRNSDGKHAPIDSELDICEECRDHVCPRCGSDQVVTISPMFPGPFGWGGRCKSCGHEWSNTEVFDISRKEDEPNECS